MSLHCAPSKMRPIRPAKDRQVHPVSDDYSGIEAPGTAREARLLARPSTALWLGVYKHTK